MGSRPNRGRLRLVEPGGTGEADVQPKPAAARTPLSATTTPVAEARLPLSSDPGLAQAAASATSTSASATRAQLAGLSDAQLVALGCKGEVPALEVLYRRHAAFAIHLAARIEGSSRDVEDIAHDAFVRAFERLGDLTDRGAFRSWLGAIVVHAVRSRMRRQRLMSLLGLGKGSEPVDLDALASPDASPHVRAQLAQIYALLRTLPTDERIAWTLRCVEGHDLESVARMTRCSLATVKRRITRAQRFLDEHFVEVDPASLPASPAEDTSSAVLSSHSPDDGGYALVRDGGSAPKPPPPLKAGHTEEVPS
jgi:RNA polymerase sigma-70 factor (ECF subfamily)